MRRQSMMRLLDRFPLPWLAVLALWMAVAPITPEPHLVEKLRMLADGTLVRPLDIFDLFLHATPIARQPELPQPAPGNV